jgi:hypothetical protein
MLPFLFRTFLISIVQSSPIQAKPYIVRQRDMIQEIFFVPRRNSTKPGDFPLSILPPQVQNKCDTGARRPSQPKIYKSLLAKTFR